MPDGAVLAWRKEQVTAVNTYLDKKRYPSTWLDYTVKEDEPLGDF